MLMGMSIGCPYYYQKENIVKLIKFANIHTDCVSVYYVILHDTQIHKCGVEYKIS